MKPRIFFFKAFLLEKNDCVPTVPYLKFSDLLPENTCIFIFDLNMNLEGLLVRGSLESLGFALEQDTLFTA